MLLLSIILLFNRAFACTDPNCARCTSSPELCNQCTSPYILAGTICALQCSSGSYPDSVNNVLQCLPCYKACLACTNGSPTGCTLCSQPKYLSCGQCVDTISDPACNTCSSQCATCYGLTPSQCYQCRPPYYYSSALQSCTLTCPQPYFGDTTTMDCLKACPTGSWGQPQTRVCAASCPDPYFMDQITTACVLLCPTQTYASARTCVKCDPTCQTCTGSQANQCLLCADGNFKANQLCGTCPPNLYSNNRVRVCMNYLEYSLSLLSTQGSQVVFELTFSDRINQLTLNLTSQLSIENIPSQYYLSFTNEIATLQSYIVTIVFQVSHRGTDIITNFTNTLIDVAGTPVNPNNSVQYLQIPPQYLTSVQQDQESQINKILIITFLCFYLMVLFICVLFKTQQRMFFLIYQNLQSIQFTILLNFTFATLTYESLDLLGILNFKQLAELGTSTSGTEIDYFGSTIDNQFPTNNFYLQADYYFSFLANGGANLMGLILLSWLFWVIAYVGHQVFQIKNTADKAQIFKTMHDFTNQLLVRIHEVCFQPIATIFLLQMWGANFDSRINIASFILAILSALYYLLYLKSVYNSQFEDQQEEGNKYHYFFADFKQANDFKKNFQFVIYAFKLFFVACLILLNNYPYVQFSLAFSSQVIYFFVILMKQPYLRPIMNMVGIFEQMLTIGLMISELLLQINYEVSAQNVLITTEELAAYNQNGLAFMIVLQILLGTYAVAFAYNKIADGIKFLDKKPDWGRGCLKKLEKFFFSDKVQEIELQNNTTIVL